MYGKIVRDLAICLHFAGLAELYSLRSGGPVEGKVSQSPQFL